MSTTRGAKLLSAALIIGVAFFLSLDFDHHHGRIVMMIGGFGRIILFQNNEDDNDDNHDNHDNDARQRRRFLALSPKAQECRSQSELLKNDYLDLYQDVQILNDWLADQTNDVICSQPQKDKMTCLLNYTAAPTMLEESCLQSTTGGGVFVMTDYVFQCTFGGDAAAAAGSSSSTLFYTAQEKPECYHAASCDIDTITTLEDEYATQAMADLVEQQGNGGLTCKRVRLKVSDPIYPPPTAEDDDSGTTNTGGDGGGNGQPQSCQNQSAVILSSWQAAIAGSGSESDSETQSLEAEATTAMEASCSNSDDGTQQLCQADFSALTTKFSSLDETCTTTLQGLYLEMNYTLTCQNNNMEGEGTADTLLLPRTISVLADPFCAPKDICTISQVYAIADLYAERIFFQTTDATTGAATAATATAGTVQPQQQEWDCSVSDLVLQDFAPRPSTDAPAPTISPSPTAAPVQGGCFERSVLLNETTELNDILSNHWEITVSEPRVLERGEPYPDGGFQYSCITNSFGDAAGGGAAAPPPTNVRGRRRRQGQEEGNTTGSSSGSSSSSWCQVVEYTPSEQEQDPAANSTNSSSSGSGNDLFRFACNDLGGMYVEEIFRIHCESSLEGNDTVVERIFHNKPACRDLSCDGVEIQQVLGQEMDTTRKAMEAELGPNSNMQCWYQDVKPLAGAGNVDGYGPNGDIPSKLKVSNACQKESDRMNTIIPIYNGNRILRRNFDEYTSVDLRQICVSTRPKTLSCQFDLEEFAMVEDDNKTENMLATACQDSGGQYVTSQFSTTCTNTDEDRTLFIYSNNYPSCVGISCSPGHAEILLTSKNDWPTDEKFTAEGYVCETYLSSVFTPSYIPPDERVPTLAPTRAPVVAPELLPTNPPNNSSSLTPGGAGDDDGLDSSPTTVLPPSSTSTSETPPAPTSKDDANEGDGPSGGAIAGGLIAVLLLLAAGAGYYYYYIRKRRRRQNNNTAMMLVGNPTGDGSGSPPKDFATTTTSSNALEWSGAGGATGAGGHQQHDDEETGTTGDEQEDGSSSSEEDSDEDEDGQADPDDVFEDEEELLGGDDDDDDDDESTTDYNENASSDDGSVSVDTFADEDDNDAAAAAAVGDDDDPEYLVPLHQ